MVYFARAKSDVFVLSDEHEDYKWFSVAELEDEAYDLSPAVKFYASKAIKKAAA